MFAMIFTPRNLFPIKTFACILAGTLCGNAGTPDSAAQPPSFVSKSAKSGRIIKPDGGNEVCERLNEVFPTPENPFYADITVVVPVKNKMLYPRLTEAEAKRAEKENAARKRKLAAEDRKRIAQEKKEAAEKRRAERHARSWMLFDEREKEKAKLREEEKQRKEELEEKDQRQKDFRAYGRVPVRELVKHPSADFFPGNVPEEIQRVNKAFKTDNEIRDWQFTGLYAPPGEIIRVHAATAGVGTGYRIRIGSHCDNLLDGRKKNYWLRFPAIVREFSVGESTVEIANPFGGKIYIYAPPPPYRKKISSSSQRRVPRYARFEFIGVVEAPCFELGETKPNEWTHLRNAPAPWAHWAGKRFIATLPSPSVRKIENPQKIIEFWDNAIEALDEIAGRERKANTPRESIVFDIDSTDFAGHAGDTIVLPLELVKTFVDINYVKEHGSWALFFFLAKNRVRDAWTFNGNKDVVAALLALYCTEKATGKKASTFFDARALNSFAMTHPEDAGTPEIIGSYLPILDAFGWEPFAKALNAYSKAKPPLSGTELEKTESFVTEWSRAAKQNLGPYFENFGIEYSPKLKMRLEKFKKFTPKNFPPELDLEKPSDDCFLGDAPLGNISVFFSDYSPPEKEEFIDFGENENSDDAPETEKSGNAESESAPEVSAQKIRV